MKDNLRRLMGQREEEGVGKVDCEMEAKAGLEIFVVKQSLLLINHWLMTARIFC